MEFESLVLEELKEIKEKQIEHTVQLAVNTQVLNEHHKRSTNLEARMVPVENHAKFIMSLMKISSAVLAVSSVILAALQLLFKN